MWLGTLYSTVGVPYHMGCGPPYSMVGYPTTWDVFRNTTWGSTYPIGDKGTYTPLQKNRWYSYHMGLGTLYLTVGVPYHIGWGTPYFMVGVPTSWGWVHPTLRWG